MVIKMEMSFYCLPLRKHVKAKVTAIVKKKSYSVKGVHKEKGKDYNLNKVVGKAEAERISKETGIDIDEGQIAAAAEEFLPNGSGNVIGQNTAGTETAIEATESTPTANTTPFRSEDEDNIGPMRMEAEVDTSPDRLPGESSKEMMERRDTPEYKAARKERQKANRQHLQKTSPYLKVKGYEKQPNESYHLDVGLPSKVLLHLSDLTRSGMEIDEIDTIQVYSQDKDRFPMIIDSRFIGKAAEEKKNCGCGQDPCVTYGAEVDQAGEIVIEDVEETSLESTGYETFVVSQEHWDKVYQHSDWDDEITEMVHVYRNSDGIAIQVPNPFSDDVLEMIIATQDMPMDSVFKSEGPSTNSSLVGLGLGIIGFAVAFTLYRRSNKEE